MKIARLAFLSLALLAGCGVHDDNNIRLNEQKMPTAGAKGGCCSGESGGGCCSEESAPQASAKGAKAEAGTCCGACAPEATAKPAGKP